METMGERIKTLRVAKGLTQEQLGEICGVSKSAVSQWEKGLTGNVRLQPFLALLVVLGTDAEYLVWGAARSPEATPKSHRG